MKQRNVLDQKEVSVSKTYSSPTPFSPRNPQKVELPDRKVSTFGVEVDVNISQQSKSRQFSHDRLFACRITGNYVKPGRGGV